MFILAKIILYTKKQEKVTHGQEKKQSTKTDSETAQRFTVSETEKKITTIKC